MKYSLVFRAPGNIMLKTEGSMNITFLQLVAHNMGICTSGEKQGRFQAMVCEGLWADGYGDAVHVLREAAGRMSAYERQVARVKAYFRRWGVVYVNAMENVRNGEDPFTDPQGRDAFMGVAILVPECLVGPETTYRVQVGNGLYAYTNSDNVATVCARYGEYYHRSFMKRLCSQMCGMKHGRVCAQNGHFYFRYTMKEKYAVNPWSPMLSQPLEGQEQHHFGLFGVVCVKDTDLQDAVRYVDFVEERRSWSVC